MTTLSSKDVMVTSPPRILAQATTDALASIDARSVFVLPLGAVEQHGAHLPLVTDTLLAERLVDAALTRVGPAADVWRLPSLQVGCSSEHHGTSGTLSLSPATLLAVLDDLARSLVSWGGERLVIVNGHGGNTPVVQTALRELRIDHDVQTFLLRPMANLEVPDQLRTSGFPELHGGAIETSLMLHVAPELVDMKQAEPGPVRWAQGREHVRFGGTVAFGWTFADVAERGIVGD